MTAVGISCTVICINTAANTTFRVGQTYACQWVTDSTMSTPQTVVARTAKFVTLLDQYGEQRKVA